LPSPPSTLIKFKPGSPASTPMRRDVGASAGAEGTLDLFASGNGRLRREDNLGK